MRLRPGPFSCMMDGKSRHEAIVEPACNAFSPVSLQFYFNCRPTGGYMYVKNVLQFKGHEIISVSPDNSLLEVAKTLRENKIGAVLVCEDAGRMCGVLSERDIIIAIAKHGSNILGGKVSDFMTEGVYTCSPDDDMKKVMEQMTRRRVRHLPVVDEGNVVGMISIGDVVKQRMAETEAETEALKSYITTA